MRPSRRRRECGWKPESTVSGSSTGLPPRTPPSGRPLDRVWIRPQTPVRGLLPSRPPGERGEIALDLQYIKSNPMNPNALGNSC